MTPLPRCPQGRRLRKGREGVQGCPDMVTDTFLIAARLVFRIITDGEYDLGLRESRPTGQLAENEV